MADPMTEETPEFIEGVRSVFRVRCIEHRHVEQFNENDASGGECGACVRDAAVEAERERIATLIGGEPFREHALADAIRATAPEPADD